MNAFVRDIRALFFASIAGLVGYLSLWVILNMLVCIWMLIKM